MLFTIARVAVALTDAAISKYDEVRARRARARAADRAVDTRRPHLWGPEQPPLCAYCKNEQTDSNAFLLCPATGEAPR